MIAFLADESLHGKIVVQLRRRHPDLDILTLHDVGLRGADDESILEWAAGNGRIVVASDELTMIGYAYDRIRQGLPMLGLVHVRQHLPIGIVLRDLNTIATSKTSNELQDVVMYLPL